MKLVKRTLYFGNGARIDIGGLTAYRPPSAEVHLGMAAYTVLCILVAKCGNVATTAELRVQVSSPPHAIQELRHAVGDDQRQYIVTVPGLGYRLAKCRLEVREMGEDDSFDLGLGAPDGSYSPAIDGPAAEDEVTIPGPHRALRRSRS